MVTPEQHIPPVYPPAPTSRLEATPEIFQPRTRNWKKIGIWTVIALAVVTIIGSGLYKITRSTTIVTITPQGNGAVAVEQKTADQVRQQQLMEQKKEAFRVELTQLGQLQNKVDDNRKAVEAGNNSAQKMCIDNPGSCDYAKQLNKEYQEETLQPNLTASVGAYNDYANKLPGDVLTFAGYPLKYGNDGHTQQ